MKNCIIFHEQTKTHFQADNAAYFLTTTAEQRAVIHKGKGKRKRKRKRTRRKKKKKRKKVHRKALSASVCELRKFHTHIHHGHVCTNPTIPTYTTICISRTLLF